MTNSGDLGDALPCPLCGYDLRGLPAGRCPECGHGFDPDALRRARLDEHPYLFEHHARRPWSSLPRTALGALRPGRFWEELRPEMALRVDLILIFAGLLAALALASGQAAYLIRVVDRASANLQDYRQAADSYEAAPPAQQREMDLNYGGRPGDFLALVRTAWPSPSTAAFWRDTWVYYNRRAGLGAATALAMTWPALTFASLLVFQQSLRRAKIKAGHLARAAVYAAAPFLLLWPIAVAVGVALAAVDGGGATRSIWRDWPALDQLLHSPHPAEVLAALLCLAGATLSLWLAHRRYLRLPHATATVLASQAMVLLAVLAALGARV